MILAAEIMPGHIANSASVVDTLDVAVATVINVTGEDRVEEAAQARATANHVLTVVGVARGRPLSK